MKRLCKPIDGEKTKSKQKIKLKFNNEAIISTSDKLKSVPYNVEQLAPTDTTVLNSGELGTGKELVARKIHRLSSRKNRALSKATVRHYLQLSANTEKQLFETSEQAAFELRMVHQDRTSFRAHLRATTGREADGTPVVPRRDDRHLRTQTGGGGATGEPRAVRIDSRRDE